ncbi:MAG: PilZ domain-containing protein [Myxococcota bacterium]
MNRSVCRHTLRLTVRVAGDGIRRIGQTTDVSEDAAFIACEPSFGLGRDVAVDVMLNPDTPTAIRLYGEVLRVVAARSEDEPALGVAVGWREARSSDSRASLEHFLRHVLGVERPRVEQVEGDSEYPFRHRFAVPRPGSERRRACVDTGSYRVLHRAFGRPSRGGRTRGRPAGGGATIRAASSPGRVPDTARRVVIDTDRGTPRPAATSGGPAPRRSRGARSAATTQRFTGAPVVSAPPPQEQPKPLPYTAAGQAIGDPRGVAPEESRRSHPRFPVRLPVSYFVGASSQVGLARDVSRTGVYVETDGPVPPVEQPVKIRLPVEHGDCFHVVMLTAVVVRGTARAWTEDGAGFAARFRVVDDLGVPGIFRHFLESLQDGEEPG